MEQFIEKIMLEELETYEDYYNHPVELLRYVYTMTYCKWHNEKCVLEMKEKVYYVCHHNFYDVFTDSNINFHDEFVEVWKKNSCDFYEELGDRTLNYLWNVTNMDNPLMQMERLERMFFKTIFEEYLCKNKTLTVLFFIRTRLRQYLVFYKNILSDFKFCEIFNKMLAYYW